MSEILHAGLIACRLGGWWEGVLIEGPSGAGKSDLALRALGAGFHLVADDRTVVFTSGGDLYGRAPDVLRDRLEVRGVGVVAQAALPFARVALAVTCVGAPSSVERMPVAPLREVLGVGIPSVEVWPFEPAAPAKLRHALERLGLRRQEAYQASLATPGGAVGVEGLPLRHQA